MTIRPTQPATNFLSLTEATFRLGDRLVFQNTSWAFRHDEQWALTGPNGSGKSLFADALRGKVPLVHGELKYGFAPDPDVLPEESIGHVAFEGRKETVQGTIAQSRWNSFEQDPERTVKDFLSYEHIMGVNPFEVADHRADRKAFERRSRRAIALLRIERFLQRDLLSLSNGEIQRVHLARALSLPLRLLILDEPFTGLDSTSKAFLADTLEHLMGTRLKVLFVTARPEELPRAVTHCLAIRDCQVTVAGPRPREASRKEPLIMVKQHSQPKRSRAFSIARHTAEKTEPILVELKNVSVRYGSATILDQVNWTIRQGESWALLGPNGAGKTTLLSLLLGDNPQTYTNQVTIFGKKRGHGESIWEIKRQIGWISPELHLHFDDSMTCMEAVLSGFHDTIGLFEAAKNAQKQAAQAWLTKFDLRGSANAPLFSLSPGLQRMVLLARALVKRPRLLILDEPCQGLDPAHRDLFLRSLDPLLASGKETAIYVSHRAEEIPGSVRKVLRLEGGKVTCSSP